MPREWAGRTRCDICAKQITQVLFDAMTGIGEWTVMCRRCFAEYGIATGAKKYKLLGVRFVRFTGEHER
jgi:hypothetical protein